MDGLTEASPYLTTCSTYDPARTWSVDQVYDWAKAKLGEKTAQKLKDGEVDGEALLLLQYQDCYGMQIPAGPRRKLLSAVAKFNGVTVSETQYIPTGYHPYTVLKDVIKPEDADKIRAYFDGQPIDPIAEGSDYSRLVVNHRLILPSLEARLKELLPDMMIYSTNYFCGDKQNGEYSDWHTGINFSKVFVGEPDTCTVWVPLQNLSEETGGRLWFYNGEYLDSVVDLLKATDKKTYLFQYIMMSLFTKELEANKVTEDCQLGDAFLFWETNPHCVDKLCKIKREVLSIRMIKRGSVVDTEFLKELEEFPEDAKVNYVENKKVIQGLFDLLDGIRKSYDKSIVYLNESETPQETQNQ